MVHSALSDVAPHGRPAIRPGSSRVCFARAGRVPSSAAKTSRPARAGAPKLPAGQKPTRTKTGRAHFCWLIAWCWGKLECLARPTREPKPRAKGSSTTSTAFFAQALRVMGQICFWPRGATTTQKEFAQGKPARHDRAGVTDHRFILKQIRRALSAAARRRCGR